MNNTRRLPLFPLTASVSQHGHLCVGGCDLVDLATEYGTPLYVLDSYTIRHRCREFLTQFTKRYADTSVIYASKAFLNKALAVLLNEEALGLDVVSGGELSVARAVDFPIGGIYFHGNNKSASEIELALDCRVGRIVVDNLYEMQLLDILAGHRGLTQDILLRVTPGVDPHTHAKTTTGTLDSKFGFPLTTGQAAEALGYALSSPNLNPLGFHFHLGSPVSQTDPYELALGLVVRFARDMKQQLDFQFRELSVGGGFAVSYTVDSHTPAVSDYAQSIVNCLNSLVKETGLNPPHLIIEPGRAIVAQAGVALYTAGAIKEIPGIRKYVCVDGGMSDNIRPPLYEARYEALIANKPQQPAADLVTIAGKLCESGDILIRDISLPPVSPGDIIAVPVCGAYCIPMSSNYNGLPKPAIVMTDDSRARLVRRRETYQDLMSLDEV